MHYYREAGESVVVVGAQCTAITVCCVACANMAGPAACRLPDVGKQLLRTRFALDTHRRRILP